jgi:hypothetical protein
MPEFTHQKPSKFSSPKGTNAAVSTTNNAGSAPLVDAIRQPSEMTLTPAVAQRLSATHGNQFVQRLVTQMQAAPQIQRGPQSETQKAVMEEAQKKAKKLSDKARKQLIKIMKKLGFEDGDVDILRNAVRGAEVTINFQANKKIGSDTVAEKIVGGGSIKNMFETGFSGGDNDKKARGDVEKNLFPEYDPLTPDSPMEHKKDRPKYASSNVGYAAEGGAYTSSYGQSAFVLKDDIKKNSTITPSDSFGANNPALVGTYDHLDHVLLARVSAKEGLQWATTILNQAKGKREVYNSGNPVTNYLELQVHSDVTMDDVAYIRASFQEAFGNKAGEALRSLASKTRPIIWTTHRNAHQAIIEPLDDAPGGVQSDAKSKFAAIWTEVENLRKQAAADGKTDPPMMAMKKAWQDLIAAMPPANLFIGDPKEQDKIPQIKGRDDKTPISQVDIPDPNKKKDEDVSGVPGAEDGKKAIEELEAETQSVLNEIDQLLKEINEMVV